MFEDYRGNQDTFRKGLPLKDLLFKQSRGQFLTNEEKERINKYAQEQRKKKK